MSSKHGLLRVLARAQQVGGQSAPQLMLAKGILRQGLMPFAGTTCGMDVQVLFRVDLARAASIIRGARGRCAVLSWHSVHCSTLYSDTYYIVLYICTRVTHGQHFFRLQLLYLTSIEPC